MTGNSLILKCVVLIGMMIGTLALCRVFPNAATDPQTGMWLRLPESMPEFHVVKVEPSKDELKWLPPDTGILKRSYLPYGAVPEDAHEWIHATLILSGNDPRSLHKPSVCLDGQGWTLTKKEVKTLEVNGHDLAVTDFTIERDTKDADGMVIRVAAHYIYWWIGKTRSTPHDWERIIYSDLDNLLRNINNRWGYPSVMVYVDPSKSRADGHREAQEKAYDFIRGHASEFQKSLAEPPVAESPPAP